MVSGRCLYCVRTRNHEIEAASFQGLAGRLVGMHGPIVNEKAALRVPVDPPRLDQRGNQAARFA